jgi:hypothetical protein
MPRLTHLFVFCTLLCATIPAIAEEPEAGPCWICKDNVVLVRGCIRCHKEPFICAACFASAPDNRCPLRCGNETFKEASLLKRVEHLDACNNTPEGMASAFADMLIQREADWQDVMFWLRKRSDGRKIARAMLDLSDLGELDPNKLRVFLSPQKESFCSRPEELAEMYVRMLTRGHARWQSVIAWLRRDQIGRLVAQEMLKFDYLGPLYPNTLRRFIDSATHPRNNHSQPASNANYHPYYQRAQNARHVARSSGNQYGPVRRRWR